jgi:hypothetical protein
VQHHLLQVLPLLCSILCCYCWCTAAAVASFVGTALVVAALQHLFAATAGAVLWTAAAAGDGRDGAAALFAQCIYSLVWYLASASAKVSVLGIS